MSIPAAAIVNVNPGVIGTGGSPLALNGLFLSQNTLLPTNAVQSFGSAAAVSAFFGPSSVEYAAAQIYFQGFDNSTIKPAAVLFAPYVLTARAAWLQSGSLAGMSLTQLQALTGVLIVSVDGTAKTSATINLAAATSFSNAATLIAAGFTGGPAVAWNPVNSTFTLTSATTGANSSMSFATGSLASGLLLGSANGALLSQGDIPDTPSTAMAAVIAKSQSFVQWTTIFEPVIGDKEAFAAWNSLQNQRYAYVVWDTDAQAIVSGATTPFGVIANSQAYDGVCPVYNSLALAAFALGAIACVDFSRKNGRITMAGKGQAGFTPTVTDAQIALNLQANGYSFYGQYATANTLFNFFYNGHVSGKWSWLDTFVNQVYLNSQLQLALMSLYTTIPSIPYNEAGYSLIRATMQDPIAAALNFGAIRVGVLLSDQQAAIVSQAAGKDIRQLLQQDGYYLQILDPGAQVRGLRGTPVINFWYMDGGAVQYISLASIAIL